MIDCLIYNPKIDTYPGPTPVFIFMPTSGVRQRAEKTGKNGKIWKNGKNGKKLSSGKKGNYAARLGRRRSRI